jgi:hypothetical protein
MREVKNGIKGNILTRKFSNFVQFKKKLIIIHLDGLADFDKTDLSKPFKEMT